MRRKIIIVAVILLFLGVGINPAIAIIHTEEDSSGLFWGTYRNCHISEEFGFTLIYPFLRSRYIHNDFALILIVTGLSSCKLSGAKGDIAVSKIIGFGFTGSIRLTPDPREPDTIEGDLVFCIYY